MIVTTDDSIMIVSSGLPVLIVMQRLNSPQPAEGLSNDVLHSRERLLSGLQ